MRRAIFLLHRWSAIVLGVLVFAWFVSGIALAYYPWPLLTESQQRHLNEPFSLSAADTGIIGFRESAAILRARGGGEVTFGRLVQREHELLYELWRDENGVTEPAALLDARTGAVLTPLTPQRAGTLALSAIPDEAFGPRGEPPRTVRLELLQHGDQYMLSHEYQKFFPAYRVQFDDAQHTAVYVSRDRGNTFGRVTSRTRWLTWLGVVPHWLYFPWLYRHAALWTWLNILLPSFAVLIAITGIVWGVTQLLPLRINGRWRPIPFRGVSRWHHVAGIVVGVLVLTWTVTGVLEMFGSDNATRAGQPASVRAGPIAWSAVLLREPMALFQAAPALGGPPGEMGTHTPALVWITFAQILGRPGYDARLADGTEVWIDAATGEARRELEPTDAATAALTVMPRAAVTSVTRLTHGDNYYYARPGREVHFPAYRVVFNDEQHSRVYLNTVTGVPVGFVDGETRAWRWWRDAMHSWDFPALNGRRPLWDVIVLPLLLGGVLSSATGLWLAVRRLRRLARGA